MSFSWEHLLLELKQLLGKLTYRQILYLGGAVAIFIILYLLRQYWTWVLALLSIAVIVGGIVAWRKYHNNSDDDSDALAVLFTEFKTAIKTAGIQKHPCFLIMGGQGKSQLLQQWAQPATKISPASTQSGTRIMDGWIGEQACFIEIGSQYHQQQQPEPSWQAFIKQLKSFNGLCPIVGILWVLDVPTLLNQYRAQALNDSLNAVDFTKLTRTVKRTLPTYYLVSQCDRLLGFNEYIRDPIVENLKILGEFNHAAVAIEKSFIPTMLQSKIINESGQEDLTQHVAAYHFVRQVREMIAIVKRIIKTATMPELAGIFLTSCPTVNTTKFICSWEKQQLQLRTFTQAQADSCYEQSSYFVKELLPELIQQSEQLLHAMSLLSHSKRSGILLVGCLLPVISATVYYPYSYVNESRQFSQLQQQLSDENHDPQQLIKSYQRINQHQHSPWPLYWGLDSQTKLLPALRVTLNRQLRYEYLQPIHHCVVDQLLSATSEQRQLASSALGALYSQLLTYLWMTNQTQSSSQAEQWLLPVWQTCLSSSTKNDLLPWLHYALQHPYDHFSVVPDLVQHVVKRLKQISPSKLVFAQMNYLSEKQFGNVAFDDLQVQTTQWSSSISIPTLYTQKGYSEVLLPILKQPNLYLSLLAKILDPNQTHVTRQQQRLFRSQLIVAYATAQLYHWQQLLDQLQLSIPLQTETNFFAEESFNQTTLDPLLVTLKQQFDWIQEWGSLAYEDPAVKSIQQFHSLIQLNSSNQDATVNTQLLHQFQDLQRVLDKVRFSSDPQTEALQITQAILSDQGQTPIKQIYETDITALQTINNPQVASLLQPIMLAPVKAVWKDLLTLALAPIEKQWRQELYQHYQQHIANHFPLASNGSDVELQDLQDFLQPQTGELWQFVNKHLKNYLEDHNGHYQSRTWLGSGLPISATFLHALDQAQIFARAIFGVNAEGKQLQLAVQFTPDPHISEVRLLSQGQEVAYLNGPERWQQLIWPGPKRLDETSLEVFDTKHQHQAIITRSGIWGIFHLLAAANKTAISSQHYLLNWPIKLGGKKIMIGGLFNIPDWMIQHVALQLPATLANEK